MLHESFPYYVYPYLLNQTQKTSAEHYEALNGTFNGVYKQKYYFIAVFGWDYFKMHIK